MQNMTGDYTSSWRLQENMDWYWTKRSVKLRTTLSSSLAVFMTSMEPTQIHQRSVPSRRCLPPQNKGELQSFLGMVTYLSPFIPQLSSHTVTLRGLLKTNVEYCWNATYQVAFDKLKSLVCEGTTLRYFNTKKPVTIQVDTSSKGLGTTLIQDNGPVTFTSKALTPTEQCYANNERELLACIFGAECFWTYVFGRHFTIESDHKSLEQIPMKNLADAPVHLQRMLLRLQDYDFTIKYRPGEEMVIADTLLRYSPEDT